MKKSISGLSLNEGALQSLNKFNSYKLNNYKPLKISSVFADKDIQSIQKRMTAMSVNNEVVKKMSQLDSTKLNKFTQATIKRTLQDKNVQKTIEMLSRV